ncbi:MULTISPECIES: ABC transporter permease [unclassified Brucella]|uniref:ABC transporter permease n=1 Tax=unclassified Brucella TaxID=2632610 RepID=UPI0012AE393D|nr:MULTISPECIES: ABC transporter permease [unclassified Brucella]MRN42348.1 ABC transporter permease [Brucella sp. 09RB8913]MRN58668.1 ABC transporter permease [Brucella sp. 09RB8918]
MTLHKVNRLPSTAATLTSFWSHRNLLMQLWRRDFAVRYKNGILGVAWAVLNPLMMLALYSFVFVFVFKMRWGAGPDTKGNFVILLFTGLVVHGFFAEFITRAPLLIATNASYVKKVVFPVELLPLVPLLGAVINFVVGMLLVALLLFYLQGSVPLTIILLPVVIAPYTLLVLGFSYFLSATGVFVRDLTHVVGILSTVAMFASPVLFPIENVPEGYRSFLYANPLTVIVEQLRGVSILGVLPDWTTLGLYSVAAIVVFFLGFSWFQAARKGFADVL